MVKGKRKYWENIFIALGYIIRPNLKHLQDVQVSRYGENLVEDLLGKLMC